MGFPPQPKAALAGQDWPGGDTGVWWEPYPEAQIDALKNLCADIVKRRPAITREWVAGHSTVDPTRKTDPGPAFPMTEVLDVVFGTRQTEFVISNREGSEDTAPVEVMLRHNEPRDDPPKKRTLCLW